MDLDKMAEMLIKAVDGVITERNVEGVADTLLTIIKATHDEWEKHLAEETTDLLMYDEILCSCGKLIEVVRKNNKVTVYI